MKIINLLNFFWCSGARTTGPGQSAIRNLVILGVRSMDSAKMALASVVRGGMENTAHCVSARL